MLFLWLTFLSGLAGFVSVFAGITNSAVEEVILVLVMIVHGLVGLVCLFMGILGPGIALLVIALLACFLAYDLCESQ